jgi:hypothetical protein
MSPCPCPYVPVSPCPHVPCHHVPMSACFHICMSPCFRNYANGTDGRQQLSFIFNIRKTPPPPQEKLQIKNIVQCKNGDNIFTFFIITFLGAFYFNRIFISIVIIGFPENLYHITLNKTQNKRNAFSKQIFFSQSIIA